MYKKITLIVLAFFASIFLVACGKSPDVTANAKGTKIGDTIKIGVNMELTGAVAAYGKSEQNGIKLAVDEINKEFQRAINEADVQIKHGLYSETLAKIDKLIADKDVSEEMKQNLQKQRDLIESQISATQAQTDFTKAQTMTENMSRDDRIREIKSRINNLVSSTNLNDENARSALYSRLADVLGLVMPSSAIAGAAQEVIKSRRLDNYVFNRMSDDEVRRFLDALDSKE